MQSYNEEKPDIFLTDLVERIAVLRQWIPLMFYLSFSACVLSVPHDQFLFYKVQFYSILSTALWD